ncbi:hypothetical protein CPB84DRAFT_1788623 [Gymnopilus junonius]|uniref:Uncharacterized protein n=1 Tax=Gymnopilus junonius TaxID=109634 RepID=A0A9P5TJW2_GYMJU|nr:hypothetical protein CPB84DRAFT_1788623 [Gymnopilus junonius]
MTQTTYLTSYSSFFSSGLLAQPAPRGQRRGTFSSDNSEPWDEGVSSPSRSSSPMPLPDDSDMEVDANELSPNSNARRSATPTPRSLDDMQRMPTPTGKAPPQSARSAVQPSSQQPQAPRLRRRRSSSTLGTNPMTVIRSPARSAGNALHLQRARSGSINNDTITIYGGSAMGMVATESTSMVGRIRSGSLSSVKSLPSPAVGGQVSVTAFRPRRAARRVHTNPPPAPLAPPPNTPLPALPPLPSPLPTASSHLPDEPKLRPADLNLKSAAQSPSNPLKSPAPTSARARGLSVSNSALDGAENRIDEEMKEN